MNDSTKEADWNKIIEGKSDEEIAEALVKAKYKELVRSEERWQKLGPRILHLLGIHSWEILERRDVDRGGIRGVAIIKAQKCYFCKKWRTKVYHGAPEAFMTLVLVLATLAIFGLSISNPIFLVLTPFLVWLGVKIFWESFIDVTTKND